MPITHSVSEVGAERLHLTASDGTRLLAGHFPSPGGSDHGFLLLPGFWGDWRRPAYLRIASALALHGPVLAANMAGHPGSSGLFQFGRREHLDAAALFDEARRRGWRQATAVGFSLGGWAFVRHLAMETGVGPAVRRLVIVSTPARLPPAPKPWRRGLFIQLMAGGKGWVWPDISALWHGEKLAESVAQLGQIPLSLVYTDRDWLVHPRHGEELRAATTGPCHWVFIRDRRGLHAEMLALFHAGALLEAILGDAGER